MTPPFRFSCFLLPLLFAAAPAAANAGCDYDITVLGEAASSLDLRVTCAEPALLAGLHFAEDSAAAFVTRLPDQAGSAVFHIDLDGFAVASDDYNAALRVGRSLIISPASILPVPAAATQEMRLRVRATDGADLAIALPTLPDGRYVLASDDVDDAGEWALGRFARLSVGGNAALPVAVLDAPLNVTMADLQVWIDDVTASNRRFWGQEPVMPCLLVIIPVSGKAGLPFGRVMAAGGATVLLLVGREASLEQLYGEWVLVHEMLHLGTPLLRDTGIWFNEGIATYFEPILRARAGWKTEDEVWREWLTSMPRSLPALTKTGLRNAPSRRAYYGGALYLLLADIALRDRSNGATGVEDCLRPILVSGADVRLRWSTWQLLRTCDAVNGQGDILAKLAQQYVFDHAPLDLGQLWHDLGVALTPDGRIFYDDSAPLASVRKTIVWGRNRNWAPIGAYRPPAD